MASPPRRPLLARCWFAVCVVVLGLSASTADAGWFDSITKDERADLRLETFVLDKRKANVGENLIATVEVSNWGNLKAKSTRLTFLAAPGATSSVGQANRIYTMDLGTLGAKLRQKYTATFTVPAWAKTGVHRFFATVESRTIETRKGNNTVATTLEVTGSSATAASSTSSSTAAISSRPVSSAPSVPSPSPSFASPTGGGHCDYYASPTGVATNNGLSTQAPFRPQEFWAVARPGLTLCLMDGRYTGGAFMLNPQSQGGPQPQGTATAPITVRALNDGRVILDGQGARVPIGFQGPTKWFVVEGVNACCSSANVVGLGGNQGVQDTTIRRVVAWDAKDSATNNADYMVWQISTENQRILLEDVAGFGVGRKVFQLQTSNQITLRRAWGRFTGYLSTQSQPRHALQASYKASNTLVENGLFTWSGESDFDGGGFFRSIVMPANEGAGTQRLLGILAYLPCNAVTPAMPIEEGSTGNLNGNNILQDIISFVEPGCFTEVGGINIDNPGGAPTLTLTRASTWGGTARNQSGNQWVQTNVGTSPTYLGSLSSPFNPTGQYARLCHRYMNGALTNEPLWPWPMDGRIKDALARAGRTPLGGADGTVTSEIESLLGPIPAACRSNG